MRKFPTTFFRSTALVIIFALVASVAIAEDASPRLISTAFQEVNSYVYPAVDMLHQSGERVIIDALLFTGIAIDTATSRSTPLSRQNFSFSIPGSKLADRLCVDLASRTAQFRKMSLLELVKPITDVTAHIEAPQIDELGKHGAMIVAFPTALDSDNPLKACLSQTDWIYPIRLEPSPASEPLTLQLRINTGGGGAKVMQLNKSGASMSVPRTCEREESANGLYNRVCHLQIYNIEPGRARIRLTIAQRNGRSVQKDFNVAIPASGQ